MKNHSERSIDAKPATGRKAWTHPELRKLRAGAAENTPGITIADGPLETIGS